MRERERGKERGDKGGWESGRTMEWEKIREVRSKWRMRQFEVERAR